jgi:hypothetical protein
MSRKRLKSRKDGRDYFYRSVLTPTLKDGAVAVTLYAARWKHGLPLQAAKP